MVDKKEALKCANTLYDYMTSRCIEKDQDFCDNYTECDDCPFEREVLEGIIRSLEDEEEEPTSCK